MTTNRSEEEIDQVIDFIQIYLEGMTGLPQYYCLEPRIDKSALDKVEQEMKMFDTVIPWKFTRKSATHREVDTDFSQALVVQKRMEFYKSTYNNLLRIVKSNK